MPASASTFTFDRTDYPLATWTGGQASEVGVDTNTNDNPIAIADFNKDGRPDIAVTDEVRNVIYLLLNDGSGKFASAAGSPFAACHTPDSLLAGDFNGDGNQDLLVDCSLDGHIELRPGDGQGGFAAASATVTGYGPMLRAPVLNHDDDVVYNITGGANAAICYVPVVAFAGAGSLDASRGCPQGIAGTENWGAAVHWYDSTCSGDEFLSVTGATVGSDYDAKVLALGRDGLNQCNTWEVGTRDSGILCCDYAARPTGMAAADLDNDGSPDVVIASASSGFHTLSGWNQATGVGTTPNPIPSAGDITAFRVVDLDGDGKLDLVAAETSPPSGDHNVVAIHPGQGSVSQFGALQSIATWGDQQNYSDAPHIAAADLNGDGRPDLVVTASGGNNGINSTEWSDDVTVLLNTTPAAAGGTGGGGGGGTGATPTPTPAPSGGGSTVTPVFAGLKIRPQTLRISRGAVHVAGTCPPDAFVQCVGTDSLTTLKAVSAAKRKRILKLGSTRFAIPAGKTKTLTIKLSKPALQLIAKVHTLKARETVVAHDQHNAARTTSATLTLKAPKKRRA